MSLFRIVFLLALTAAPAAGQITGAEHAARRDSLAGRIGNGIVIAFGGSTPTADFGPFYQLPAFRYLTGYQHANATLIMVVRNGRHSSTLFVSRTEPRRALYYGSEPDSATIAGELRLASRDVADLVPVADSLARSGLPWITVRDVASTDFAAADSLTRGGQFMKALAARHPWLVVHDGHPTVAQLRARKSDAELALIRKAAAISSEGHRAAMKQIEPGMHEYDLQAIIEYTFRRGGSERPAYGSIVGSGPLSLQLHYMKDRRKIEPGEVVVIDAGAEFDGYTADVTRTLPIDGVYTEEQRNIYRLVRDAQDAAERNSKAGMSMAAALDSSVAVRAKGLAALGLIEGADAMYDPPGVQCGPATAACRQVNLFTIHTITHGIGLEVHDPIHAYQDGKFAVGDAFTIEPGIYISTQLLDMLPDTPRNRAFAAKVRKTVERYQNTGVRIEDSYVVTKEGLERISLVPRDLEEVEALTRRPIP